MLLMLWLDHGCIQLSRYVIRYMREVVGALIQEFHNQSLKTQAAEPSSLP
jgi:hypothetical protein